jgi:hypothetical protein
MRRLIGVLTAVVLVGLLVVPAANAGYVSKVAKLVGQVEGDANSRVVLGLRVKPYVPSYPGFKPPPGYLNITARDVEYLRYANVNDSCAGIERTGSVVGLLFDPDVRGGGELNWIDSYEDDKPFSFDGRWTTAVYPDDGDDTLEPGEFQSQPDGVVTKRRKAKRPWRASASVAMHSNGSYDAEGYNWTWGCTDYAQFKVSGRSPKF